MRRLSTSIATCAAVALALAGAAPVRAQSVADVVRALEVELARDVAADSVGSIAAAVVVEGRLVWEGAFGWADRRSRRLATPGTVYRAGSITKAVTAVVLLRLVERGVVELDRPVAEHLPEIRRLANLSPDHAPITFRHLAAHTAGLAREPATSFAGRGAFRAWRRRVVEAIPVTEVVGRPGAAYGYSNIGYALLGFALERAAGRPFQALVRELVLDPLEMTSAGLLPPRDRSRLATGYVNLPGDTADPRVPRAEHRGRGYRVPGEGLYATAADLARLIPALSTGGRLIPEPLRREMLDADAGYGLGLHVHTIGDVRVAAHSGTVAGYTAYLAFHPVTATGLVLLRNYNNGATNLGATAERTLLELVDAAAR